MAEEARRRDIPEPEPEAQTWNDPGFAGDSARDSGGDSASNSASNSAGETASESAGETEGGPDANTTDTDIARAVRREIRKAGSGKKNTSKRNNKSNRKPAPEVIEIQPIASNAGMRRRHWGLVFSLLLFVLAPFGALFYYLWFEAIDQYASSAGFTVRQEESASATDLLGGLANFAGGSSTRDGDILYEFIQSQGLLEDIDRKLDLRGHYSAHWDEDKLFSLWPDATIEELLWYWQRVVRISYDQGTGLMELRVLAFDPEFAQAVTREIVAESQAMINDLNAQAREDAMRYARADLEEAIKRLKVAREALTQFRTRTQIVDPAADIQSRLGVMANLQQQLAEALIDYDLLRGTTNDNDPRVTKARRMIDVIRERISIERQTFTSESTDTGALGEDYPSLIAEYESLTVDREFAEQAYTAALTALDVARANAARQTRYLAEFVQPTLASESKYPSRYIILALAALFLLLTWSILALIYYSLRDRR